MFASCSLTLRSVSIGLLWLWRAGRARDAAIVRWVYFVHPSCDRLALRLAIVSLWVQQLYILAAYCGYSDYAFYLCTVGTVVMYSSCVMWAHLLYILGVYCE